MAKPPPSSAAEAAQLVSSAQLVISGSEDAPCYAVRLRDGGEPIASECIEGGSQPAFGEFSVVSLHRSGERVYEVILLRTGVVLAGVSMPRPFVVTEEPDGWVLIESENSQGIPATLRLIVPGLGEIECISQIPEISCVEA